MYKVYHYSVISCMFTNVESVRVRFTRDLLDYLLLYHKFKHVVKSSQFIK